MRYDDPVTTPPCETGCRGLTARFEDALGYAARLHSGHVRKGTAIPYVAHLLAVAGLVLEHGGDEDEAIAALLHDAAEDCGGRPILDAIRGRFGERVAAIVEGCSDSLTAGEKAPWWERKTEYLKHLRNAPPSVRLVSAADKLHNARAILADYRSIGDDLWERFTAKREGTLWYYGKLVDLFRDLGPHHLAEELTRVVSELRRLVSVHEGPGPFSPNHGSEVLPNLSRMGDLQDRTEAAAAEGAARGLAEWKARTRLEAEQKGKEKDDPPRG
jgi:(p)ppGpp synthase/HD superfamily hydrolase